VLKLFCVLSFSWAHAAEIVAQALTWQGVQQQLIAQRIDCDQLIAKKTADNKEFFNLQQQLGAIYLAQKRYQLGFGTAFMPSEKAVHNYVRKKTFLDLKTKELLPLYKKKVLEYQKRYTTGELERIQKNLKKLEALNLLHIKLFDQLNIEHAKKSWVEFATLVEIPSLEGCLKTLPFGTTIKKSVNLLSWISPVAGISDNQNLHICQPIEGAVVLCPDDGVVAAINRFENTFVVFIKQRRFTYAVKGFSRCCVKVGDKLKQGEPLGMCALKNPPIVELQLWRDDIALDPQPYHQPCHQAVSL
jgi:hypothetical protein